MRITSTFDTEAEAFAASTVDYDDVLLRATLIDPADGDDDGGGGGGRRRRHRRRRRPGGDGPGGIAGDGSGAVQQRGNRLFLRLKCLGVTSHNRCKVRAVAYAGKGGAPDHVPGRAQGEAKNGKRVALRVRPRFVKQLSASQKVLVRSQIRAGDRKAVKFQRYKLTQR